MLYIHYSYFNVFESLNFLSRISLKKVCYFYHINIFFCYNQPGEAFESSSDIFAFQELLFVG